MNIKDLSKSKLKIYCTACDAKIDVTDQVSFSKVNCPACSEPLTVPKKLGTIYLVEKLEEDQFFENFCGIKDSNRFTIKILKKSTLLTVKEIEKSIANYDLNVGILILEEKMIFLCPWHETRIKLFEGNESGSKINKTIKLFTQIYTELNVLIDKRIYLNNINPKTIFIDGKAIIFNDLILKNIVAPPEESTLEESIRETGKVFNYLLFDHTEDYQKWTERYLRKGIENNYYQFPWVIKGKDTKALRNLIRNMILIPNRFENFNQIKDKLNQINIENKTKPASNSGKKASTSNTNKNNSPNLAVKKITRSVNRTKKTSQSLSKGVLFTFILLSALTLFFFTIPSTDDRKEITDNTNDTDKTGNTVKSRKTAKLYDVVTNRGKDKKEQEQEQEQEQESLRKVIEDESLDTQEELNKFLARINPPDDVKAKYNALPPVSSSHLQALMNKHCNDCHNSRKRKGDFALDIFTEVSSIFQDYSIIKHAYESVKLGEMPPEDEEITDKERRTLTEYFEKIIYTLESKQIDVKSSTIIRRLTPYEYDYTVKDITGLDLKLGKSFPGDGGGNQGFSNDASLMGVTPIQMEKFLEAAQIISTYSTFDIHNGFQFKNVRSAPMSNEEFEKQLEEDLYAIYKIYPKSFEINRYLPKLVSATAEYLFSKNKNKDLKKIASRHKVRPLFLTRSINYFDSPGPKSLKEVQALAKWKSLQLRYLKKDDKLKDSLKEVAKSFTESFIESKKELNNRQNRNRTKHIQFVKNIESIFHLNPEDASKFINGKELISYRKSLSVLNFLRYSLNPRYNKDVYHIFEPFIYKFMTKVNRRPPNKKELFTKTNDFINDVINYGVPLASRIFVIRSFSSLNFTFRIEKKTSKKVDHFDLASRLSYFLWAGPPDEELLALAENGSLNTNEVIDTQIKRMLKDGKSARLAKHFASQWLRFGDILEYQGPSKRIFKGFNKNLAKDMWQETAISFNYMVKNDLSVLSIFNADYTFVNKRLSDLYGFNQNSPVFKKVYAKNSQRGGILGHASILTMTSLGQRTSPIIRGNWILSVLLGTPTPPPPMNVEPLPEEDVLSKNFTLKEQLAKHRDNPACRSCHKKIDPLGIVLENYDPVGRWRTKYQKVEIDALSEIDGSRLNGPADLKKYLMKNKIQYIRNLSTKLLSYSLGRSIYYYDNYLINKMIENSIRNDYQFSALIKTIVLSPQFQLK